MPPGTSRFEPRLATSALEHMRLEHAARTASADSGGVMKAVRYRVALDEVPVDFFADPDGEWTYDELLAIAGWQTSDGVAIGALTAPFQGHPAGSAVVTLNAKDRPYIVVVECSERAVLATVA